LDRLVREREAIMKRVGELWDRVVSFQALHAAYLRARKGKRFTPEALAFEANREGNLARLAEELESGTYRPGPYRTFTIRDPKPRLISAAPFRDRVVHHALVAAIAPVFEPAFIFDSYANRRGKGTHAALRRYQAWCRTYPFALRCDIEKFFPSIDHEILKTLLRRKLKDRRVLDLCGLIIDGSNPQPEVIRHFPGDDLFTPSERRRGLPIGNLTSQFWQNVYLNPLDHFVKEQLRCRAYLRYVDDFILLDHDKARLRQWRTAIEEFLQSLRLRPNPSKFEVSRTRDGLNWVGFLVFPHDCRVRRQRRVLFRRRLRRAWEQTRTGLRPLSDLTVMVRSWVAHAAHARSAGLRRHLLSRCPPWLGGGAPRRAPRAARRLLEQQSEESPLGQSQQEPS
jgi:hypothetical protein